MRIFPRELAGVPGHCADSAAKLYYILDVVGLLELAETKFHAPKTVPPDLALGPP